MDELDLLKKDWKRKEGDLPRLSYDEIYRMILKKSSSNIKWIFIISCIELFLGLVAAALYHPSISMPDIKLPLIYDIIGWVSIPVIIIFIYRFFVNYQKVSTSSSVKGLINDIIRARRTVKYYIIFNLSLGGILAFIATIYAYAYANGGWESFRSDAGIKDYILMIGIALIATVIVLGFVLGIYYLLYGILMKRLKKNFKELKQMGQ